MIWKGRGRISFISDSFAAAAIKASLAETLENGGGGESSDEDLETFTDDDNTNNSSFDFKKKSASGKNYLLAAVAVV